MQIQSYPHLNLITMCIYAITPGLAYRLVLVHRACSDANLQALTHPVHKPRLRYASKRPTLGSFHFTESCGSKLVALELSQVTVEQQSAVNRANLKEGNKRSGETVIGLLVG